MATLERAVEIAVAAHKGQRDKGGGPYVLHPLRVMFAVAPHGEAAQIVGVLHDVVEDTAVTPDDLRREGFAEAVLASLARVTHARGVSYADYVVAAKADAVARAVKLADLHDNARLDRVMLRPEMDVGRDWRRVHRYLLAYKFLTDAMGEADYRRLMATEEA